MIRVNDYFDKVYVLSLPFSIDRRKAMQGRLKALKIEFEFIDAKDGNSIRNERMWAFYKNRGLGTQNEIEKGKKFIESLGAWGCLESFIYILRQILKKGYRRTIIFEDDVFFSVNFEEKFSEFINSIPRDEWKVLELGASEYGWSQRKINSTYYHPGKGTHGAFAIGLDKSIVGEMLIEAMTRDSPLDNSPFAKVFIDYPKKCFVSFPNMVIADVRKSYLRGSRDMISHGEKMKWNSTLR